MFGDDLVKIDVGGFLFFRNYRYFKRDEVKAIEHDACSCSMTAVPTTVELKSGEVVMGTQDLMDDFTKTSAF